MVEPPASQPGPVIIIVFVYVRVREHLGLTGATVALHHPTRWSLAVACAGTYRQPPAD